MAAKLFKHAVLSRTFRISSAGGTNREIRRTVSRDSTPPLDGACCWCNISTTSPSLSTTTVCCESAPVKITENSFVARLDWNLAVFIRSHVVQTQSNASQERR